jgi:predicted dehydrogenase
MNAPIRIGLLGTGFIAGAGHLPGIASYPGAEAVIVCDTDAARLAAFADTWHIAETRATWDEVLDPTRVDAVSVCLPNSLHAAATLAALERGLHVMCEKPMALTVADADAMVEASRHSTGLLAIKVHNRYRRSSLEAKRLIEAGALGEVYHAEVNFYRRDGIPGVGSWFTQRALSGGGALADNGIHGLDATLWLLGNPAVEAVSGIISDRIGQAAARGDSTAAAKVLATHRIDPSTRRGPVIFDVEDSAFALLRAAGDISIAVTATWAASRDDAESLTILGTAGGLTLDWANGGDSLHFYGPTPEQDTHTVFDPADEPGGLGAWSAAHVRSTHAFLDAIAYGRPTPVDPASVATVMHVIDAVYASAAAGREVRL